MNPAWHGPRSFLSRGKSASFELGIISQACPLFRFFDVSLFIVSLYLIHCMYFYVDFTTGTVWRGQRKPRQLQGWFSSLTSSSSLVLGDHSLADWLMMKDLVWFEIPLLRSYMLPHRTSSLITWYLSLVPLPNRDLSTVLPLTGINSSDDCSTHVFTKW